MAETNNNTVSNEVEFDYLRVCVSTYAFPDEPLCLSSGLTLRYADREVAELSLAHIQKTVPHAYLEGSISVDRTPEFFLEKQRIVERDKHYRRVFKLDE